jgi:hypothetical protein
MSDRCCCPSRDARLCYLIRYNNYNREMPGEENGEPEKCECVCHRDDAEECDDEGEVER